MRKRNLQSFVTNTMKKRKAYLRSILLKEIILNCQNQKLLNYTLEAYKEMYLHNFHLDCFSYHQNKKKQEEQ